MQRSLALPVRGRSRLRVLRRLGPAGQDLHTRIMDIIEACRSPTCWFLASRSCVTCVSSPSLIFNRFRLAASPPRVRPPWI